MAALNNNWQIYVNGAPIAHTAFNNKWIGGTNTTLNGVTGQAILVLQPADVVTLVNVCGSTNGVVADGSNVNASISIVKISA